MMHKKNMEQLERESQSAQSPSEFMRARHPNLFSDSTIINTINMPRESFEYYLDTLTNRKQEIEFEHFCRRLAEKELCPNLIPQTGPTGGGDSQVDTETYPVADQIAIRWYEGIGQEAFKERWAFAFSAKKDWRTKVKSDVEKIINTNRGYQLAYFITNQFVKDRTRVEVEDSLKSKYGIPIRILDRSWIVKCVFEHDLTWLAAQTLQISEYGQEVTKRVGPRDVDRQVELNDLESQINDQERYHGIEYQLAEDCLDAALLARGLELPRIDVEGRFQRAVRIANRVGIKQQKLRVIYNLAWTEYWWYEDYVEFNSLYCQVEELAIGSEQADDIELLVNLLQVLQTAVKHGLITEENGKLSKRKKNLKADLDRLASEEHRPNNALQARTNRLLLDLTEAFYNRNPIDPILEKIKDTLKKSLGLSEYPIVSIIKIIQELGSNLTDSPKYDELLEVVVEIAGKRTSEGEVGKILLQRGIQKFQSGKNYDAIKLIGRAQQKLAMDEYKSDWITSLVICGLAYEEVGLLWAARANLLMATNQAFSEYIKNGKLEPATLRYVQRLVWLELQIGRLPHILSWMDFSSFLAKLMIFNDPQKENYLNERDIQDRVLAILLLKTDFWNLKWLDFIPTVLDEMGLYSSWMTVLYTLGYENLLREEEVIPAEESSETIQELFHRLSLHPASIDIPEHPEFLNGSEVNLISPVLGCEVIIKAANNENSIYLAENIVGALEAFLATSFDSNLYPYRSELHIKIHPNEFLTGLPEYTINERKQGEIGIHHPTKILKRNTEERTSYRDWLQELIVNIILQIAFIPDTESYINEVVKNERSFDRAIMFSDVEIALTNLLGEHPKIRLSDWKKAESKKFPLKRDTPWNYSFRTSVERDTKKPPLKFGVGDPPESLFDINKLRHKDRKILSFINVPLWNKAKWQATGFICFEGSAPILALCFENTEAAKQIFQEWMDTLGEIDESNKLRISIIIGVDKKKPLNYRVVVTTNLEGHDQSESNHFIITSRCNEMSPKTNEHLNYFLSSYNKEGKFILVPATMDSEKNYPIAIGKFYIGKHHLVVRPAWEIDLNDPDMVAIHKGDDPIIPKETKDAPIFRVLHWLDSSKKRKRH
jgi:hypothetical protein